MSATMEHEGIGVLYCCGKRLVWQKMEGTAVLEVTCGNCGTVYAMDRGENLDDVVKESE